jgi:hypothetical protein
MKTILLLLTATLLPAQDVATPSIGMMTDARGSLRPVYGVAGSFVVGEEAGTAMNAPPGGVVLGIDGDAAWIYFPHTARFARFTGGTLTDLDWHVDGEVLSIGPGPRIAVRRPSGVWIVRPDGAVVDALPDATGPVLLLENVAVFAATDEIVLQRADRSQLRLPLAGVRAIAPMSADWLQVSAATGEYALRITPGKEALYVLPAPAAQRSRRR